MARNRQNLNIIYISDRMRETLRPIASCALTAVVAPMGYGKTTAVRWFLAEQAKAGAVVLQASIYSDNRSIFWKSVQKAFAAAGLTVLEGYDCPADASGAALLLEDLCAALGGKTPYYLFLDDFHLLGDERVAQFLCRLAYRLPENVHLIVASRNRFLPGEQVVRLGRRLHRIEADGLRLNREELLAYTHRCGVEITAAQAESLLRSCEGWFSAVYLNLHALAERGSLLQPGPDIYAMFTAAMLESLPEKTRGFLAVMGLADEFTVEMARAVTALPDAEEVLRALTQQNAFVTRLPDGVSFRFHHMMKECAERLFAQLPAARQTEVWQRYGRWYAQKAQYLHALQAFEHCGDRDAALAVIEADAGDLLASLSPAELLQRLDRCPVEALQRHPLAILVLMRRMFTWQQIPKMMELKALLEAAVAQHPEWPAAERGNLLGECDLIQSFLFYNDITQMSRLHRSASRQMSRPAVTLRNSGSWTFGSPSVLMMYYRAPGELGKELAEMYECMPHYYKITNGHGRGAELLMDAEAAYLQGAWEKAAVLLERARADAAGQENMTLCCDFLALRLALCGKGKEGYDFAAKRAALLQKHDGVQVHLLESIAAYFYALQGRPEQAPTYFKVYWVVRPGDEPVNGGMQFPGAITGSEEEERLFEGWFLEDGTRLEDSPYYMGPGANHVGNLDRDVTFYGHWRTAESGEGSPDGGDGFGTLLAGVAVVGAAGVVAYQVGTELILDQLLPAGVAVPHTRAELAMLLWNTAGRPAPATLPAFADVADPELAQAAQWAIEQGYLKARADGSFKPDKGVAKWRVIRGYRAVTEP